MSAGIFARNPVVDDIVDHAAPYPVLIGDRSRRGLREPMAGSGVTLISIL